LTAIGKIVTQRLFENASLRDFHKFMNSFQLVSSIKKLALP
jgi:hypothetical protein